MPLSHCFALFTCLLVSTCPVSSCCIPPDRPQIMQEGVAGAQAGWLMACKELFGRGKASDAMLLFLRGVQQQGYTGDAGLYAYAIQEMCKQGKLVGGWDGSDRGHSCRLMQTELMHRGTACCGAMATVEVNDDNGDIGVACLDQGMVAHCFQPVAQARW